MVDEDRVLLDVCYNYINILLSFIMLDAVVSRKSFHNSVEVCEFNENCEWLVQVSSEAWKVLIQPAQSLKSLHI